MSLKIKAEGFLEGYLSVVPIDLNGEGVNSNVLLGPSNVHLAVVVPDCYVKLLGAEDSSRSHFVKYSQPVKLHVPRCERYLNFEAYRDGINSTIIVNPDGTELAYPFT